MSRILLLKKKIDWSVFDYGITIPIGNHQKFFAVNGDYLARGQSHLIDLTWNGQTIPARINNVARGTESDTLQIKYSKGSPVSEFFKAIFQRTYIYIIKERQIAHKLGQNRPQIKVPPEEGEYLFIYSTTIPYVYEIECQTQVDEFYYQEAVTGESNLKEVQAKISLEQENKFLGEKEIFDFRITRFKDLASKIENPKQIKRTGTAYYSSTKLKEDVKQHYDYTCQICFTQIKKKGWTKTLGRIEAYKLLDADAHHVKPLGVGGPDSPYNILCVCPNCHRRLHVGQFEIVFEQSPICYDIFDRANYRIAFREGHRLVNY